MLQFLKIFSQSAFALGNEWVGLPTRDQSFAGLVTTIINAVLQPLVLLFIGAGVVYFLWGVLQYLKQDDEKAREEGKMKILYGLIALFVMVSVWGLVNVLSGTFNLTNNSAPPLPYFGH